MNETPHTSPQSDAQSAHQSSHEHYAQLSEHAHRQIMAVGSFYKTAAWCVVALFALAGLLFWNSIRDMKNDMKERFQNNMDAQNAKVSNRIDEEFKQENIRALVQDKARQHLDAIAPPLVKSYIEVDLAGRLEAAETDIASLRELNKKAELALSQMNNGLDYLNLTLAVQNDSRQAFDKLWKMSKDISSSYRESALNACFSAFKMHTDRVDMPRRGINTLLEESERLMPGYTNVQNIASADRFRAGRDNHYYNNIAPLVFVWHSEDLDESFKINMMAEAMQHDPSLSAAYYAAKRLADKNSLYWGPSTQFEPIIAWWKENKANYPTDIYFDN